MLAVMRPTVLAHPEREGIYRYYTCEHAPWDYFQPALNPDAPQSLCQEADDSHGVAVGPEMVSNGADLVATGRRLLTIYPEDEDAPSHPLDGTTYDTDEDAYRAAYNAGLMVFQVMA